MRVGYVRYDFGLSLEAPMTPLTTFLSRLIGLFLILVGLSVLTHKQATEETLIALTHTPLLLFVLGMIFLIAGLAIVLKHNIWSGGVLPVVVTLFGWIILIRGLLLLFLSPETLGALFTMARVDQFFYLYIGISILIGAYLTYGGFSRSSRALSTR